MTEKSRRVATMRSDKALACPPPTRRGVARLRRGCLHALPRCRLAALPLLLIGLTACSQLARDSRPAHARPYPEELVQSETLDIQVQREETKIKLTNTAARAFGPSTIWVNERYSRPIEGLNIGESVTIPLHQFRDEHATAFRAGGFWATERPETLVLAQLETIVEGESVLLGLIVVEPIRR